MTDFTRRELAWFDAFADIARDADGHMLWDGDNRMQWSSMIERG